MRAQLRAEGRGRPFVLFDRLALTPSEQDLLPGTQIVEVLAAQCAAGCLLQFHGDDGECELFVDESLPPELAAAARWSVEGAMLRVPSGTLHWSHFVDLPWDDTTRPGPYRPPAKRSTRIDIAPGNYRVSCGSFDGLEAERAQWLRQLTTAADRRIRVFGEVVGCYAVFLGGLGTVLTLALGWWEGKLAHRWHFPLICAAAAAAGWLVLSLTARSRALVRRAEQEVAQALPEFAICLERLPDDVIPPGARGADWLLDSDGDQEGGAGGEPARS